MKTLTIIIFLLFNSANVYSQFILASGHSASQDHYYDNSPDDSLGSVVSSFNYVDDLIIDINNDGVSDFILTAKIDTWGGWHGYHTSSITPLDNNKISISRYDSCNALCPSDSFLYRLPMAKAFSINDSINDSQLWLNSIAYLSFFKFSATFPNPCGYGCDDQTFSSGSNYIGVQVYIPGDTLYGWINIHSTTNHSFVVAEYACNMFSTDITTYSDNSLITVFPNPSNGVITIKSDLLGIASYTVKIYNTLGEIIYDENINSIKTTIDLNNKSKGIYFINITSEYENFTKKIVLE